MTEHAHDRFVEGCFRCELSRDEAMNQAADLGRLDEWIAADLTRRFHEEADIVTREQFFGHGNATPRGILGSI